MQTWMLFAVACACSLASGCSPPAAETMAAARSPASPRDSAGGRRPRFVKYQRTNVFVPTCGPDLQGEVAPVSGLSIRTRNIEHFAGGSGG